jgi:alpha-tubulin suppressor-like RCC1 family protein
MNSAWRLSRLSAASARLVVLASAVGIAACNTGRETPLEPIAEGSGPARLIDPAARFFVQVAAGGRHTCTLRNDGAMECFDRILGQFTYAQRERFAPTGSYTYVSARDFSTCAVRDDGSAECDPDDMSFEIRTPPSGRRFTQAQSGGGFWCALRDDGVVNCWGRNSSDQAPPERAPVTGRFTQLAVGDQHGCALRDDGVVECWGPPPPVNVSVAPPIRMAPAGLHYAQVSSGQNFTCALRSDGVVECWGASEYEQAPPTRAATRGSFVQLGVGLLHGCALRDDGVVECWGLADQGQAPAERAATSGRFTQVSGGRFHTCALRDDGAMECWGDNTELAAPAVQTALPNRILPTATFTAPPSVILLQPIQLALTNAQVPGFPSATSFTYAFDCGSGYGPATPSSATACPTTVAGPVSVRGRVIDQDADFTDYVTVVRVRSPSEGTTDLRAAIGAANLSPDLRNALIAKLNAALDAIARGRVKSGCVALQDFINQVNAQRGKAIDPATADAWLLQASQLRTALGC